MTSTEEQIAETMAMLDHVYDFIEPLFFRFFEKNPSYDPSNRKEIDLSLIQPLIRNGRVQTPQVTDIEKLLSSIKWKDVMELARAVKGVSLTEFREISVLSNTPVEWVLTVLSQGKVTKKGDRVSYACYDGRRVIWVGCWKSDSVNLQPGGIYKFRISTAVKYPPRDNEKYDNFTVSLVPKDNPVFIKSLYEFPHTPLPPRT